jgi:hypothetical protein
MDCRDLIRDSICLRERDLNQIQALQKENEELKANWAETIRSKDPLVKEINRLRKENKELKEHYATHKKVV